ncbi:MAG: nucleotide pyrophosphohydrolase [Proteobacteria bacterium]|nr:nucleotide pyrophosphohydrolase [Pseudomonadota bacterium]MCP4920126.1 nucleotide pyrophosphohydrolase [Pseudomonadota bacterium]
MNETNDLKSLSQLEDEVRAFSDERDWGQFHSPRNLAMAVSVEASELLELYLWSADGEARTPERTARAAEEMADVLICLLNLSSRTGIDLQAAVEAKLAKNEEKYPADQVRGQAKKYDEY